MSGLVNMAEAGEPLDGSVSASEPSAGTESRPTPYEVRRDALMAAATYCSGGGWGGMENVITQAHVAEKFLKGAL